MQSISIYPNGFPPGTLLGGSRSHGWANAAAVERRQWLLLLLRRFWVPLDAGALWIPFFRARSFRNRTLAQRGEYV